MIRYFCSITVLATLLLLPAASPALLVQINDMDLPYQQAPTVGFQAEGRVLVVDSDGAFQCSVSNGNGPGPGVSDGLRLVIDGAELDLLGSVTLSLEGGLPRLSMNTANGSVTCSQDRIYRDRFALLAP